MSPISERVYVLDARDAEPLRKLLAYDPYLDVNLIPKLPAEWDDKKYLSEHPEVAKEAEEKRRALDESVRKLREDKEANLIFARQDYQLKDGAMMGLDRDKCYLFLNAPEDFQVPAEAKLKKNVKSIERLDQETERKVIDAIEKERESAEQGLGMIFGQ